MPMAPTKPIPFDHAALAYGVLFCAKIDTATDIGAAVRDARLKLLAAMSDDQQYLGIVMAKKVLKSLDEHNAERHDYYRVADIKNPVPNGIACPTCGKEMVDTNPYVILTSDPPQMNVRCPACGYTGYRVA